MIRHPARAGIKLHFNYTYEEIARALGVSKGTVREWVKRGLPALTEQKPHLVLGQDLIEFHARRKAEKARCALNECYCFRCRAPSMPAFGEVEILAASATTANMRALCERCATVMHKRISLKRLPELEQLVRVRNTQADKPLIDSADPCANHHFGKG
ncbi:MAG: hypothetical protein Kow0026_28560 [Oricola sp.]